MKPFLEAVKETPLLWDGAMGSLLYERGVFLTRSFDELNLSQPELIRGVHLDYVEAGCDVLETNTFSSNRIALAKHGHAEKVSAINTAAVRIAREAVVGREVYIAGAVGPTGLPYDDLPAHEKIRIDEALDEQVQALVSGGVDLLLFETFASLEEALAAVRVGKKYGVPVAAQVVFDMLDRTCSGRPPLEVAQRLIDAGADVVGANCGAGPPELFDVGTQMVPCGVPISVQPNAGLPRVVEGRTLYIANPEHFGVFARRLLQAGVRMVGGCCGTTPEHTRRMLGAVRMLGARPLSTRIEMGSSSFGAAHNQAREPVPFAQRSALAAKLAAGEFVVSCELSSPSGVSPAKTIEAARRAHEGGIDVVNIADGPRATSRMSNVALCGIVQKEAQVETILHVCCRDRNFLGLIAHLLGAHATGLRNLVIITGDPPKIGDYPFATPVYDLDSIGLLKLAADLNQGIDPGGKKIAGQTSFVLATGAEPGALDYERELKRLEMKKAAGAELIMTQPVYDGSLFERFLDDTKHLGLPIMVGLLPLASHRNAEFLHNEVPGMRIPDEIRARMAKAESGPPARAEGIRIAAEALLAVKSRVAGAYIMPPFDRVESALEILRLGKIRSDEIGKIRGHET